jgi:hypothetical protein
MKGVMAILLKKAVRSYLENRFKDRFDDEEYELLAEEFKSETTSEEFTALRKSDGDERSNIIRGISSRIQARVSKSGSKEDKDLMKRFMKAREETSTSRPAAKSGRSKRA